MTVMDVTLTTTTITSGIFGIIITAITSVISLKVNAYIRKRDRLESEKIELQKIHNMKLEAMIYAVLSYGPHRDEIKKAYDAKLDELRSEEKYIREMTSE